MFLSQVSWSLSQLNQVIQSSRGCHHLCSSAWTMEATWEGRYSKQRKLHVKVFSLLLLHWRIPCVVTFRRTTQRQTAPSESSCWQTDTRASFPHTVDFRCRWLQNQGNTTSPSLDSYRFTLVRQRRASLNNQQATSSTSTWTLTTCLGWAYSLWSVLSSQSKSKACFPQTRWILQT